MYNGKVEVRHEILLVSETSFVGSKSFHLKRNCCLLSNTCSLWVIDSPLPILFVIRLTRLRDSLAPMGRGVGHGGLCPLDLHPGELRPLDPP